jgi:choline dehydrogenase-like flavoprotein
MGGATLAAALAPTGRRILILERGERLRDSPEARDPAAIFQRGHFKPNETWRDIPANPFNPGNYAFVGGNTKFYGAVLLRYRAEDFAPLRHIGGTTPGWPIAYDTLEPWYSKPKPCTACGAMRRATRSSRRTPPPTPSRRCRTSPTSPPCAPAFAAQGLHPSRPAPWRGHRRLAGPRADHMGRLPLHHRGQVRRRKLRSGRSLAAPQRHPQTGTRVLRLLSEGRRVTGSRWNGTAGRETLTAPTVCLCAGAMMSSALLLASADAEPSEGAGERFRSGRAQLHEPQPDRDGGLQPLPPEPVDSMKRPSRSTTST